MKRSRFSSFLLAAVLALGGAAACNTEDDTQVTNNGGENNGGTNNGGENNGGENNGGTNNGGTNNGGTNNGGTNNGGTNNGCVPTGQELCGDGVDNDCDGEVDEGFDDLGTSCTAGLGPCEETGMMVCTSDGMGLECDATAGTPEESDEATCDDIDNDCDGEVDEGCDDDGDGYCDADFTVTGSPAVCTNGADDCDDDSADAYPGAPGICGDNIDNDCDGTADNFGGVDQTDPTFEIAGFGASGNSEDVSPILATPSDTGFCVAVYDAGTGDLGMAHIDLSTGMVESENRARSQDSTFSLQDIGWDGTSCVAVYKTYADSDSTSQKQDVYAVRYVPGATSVDQMEAVENGATGSNDLTNVALETDGTQWVIAYVVQGDNTSYVTIPSDFDFNSSTLVGPLQAGPILGWIELGPTPNPADDLLFAGNFINTVMRSISIGSNGVSRDDLRLAPPYGTFTSIEEVGGKVYAFTGGSSMEFGAHELLDSYQLGSQGSGTFAAETNEEFISRNVATDGPQSSMWFTDPWGDFVYTFTDDGTDITFNGQDHPNLTGEVLAITQDGDEVVVLSMTDVGTSGSMTQPVTLTAYSYTCF